MREQIKLLIIDVDGIMTDGIKYYNRDGEVKLKTFCDKDWTYKKVSGGRSSCCISYRRWL